MGFLYVQNFKSLGCKLNIKQYKSFLLPIKMKFDYLIVGAGFSGAVLAERLSGIGKKVLVVEKRNHIGGNCYDFFNKNGVLVHKYGPHYFRTNSDKVITYLSQFTEWLPCRYVIKTFVNGEFYPIPINRETINKFFKVNLKTEKEVEKFLEGKREKIKNPKNAEEQVLSLAGREIYEAFFKNYTIKQWDTHPRDLDASVTARIPIRTNNDDGYFNDKFQAMPKEGYTKIFEKMLKKCEVLLKTDYWEIKDKISYDKLIYTGPIDSFFKYKHGKLPYRSLKITFESYKKEFYQDWVQVNYPNDYQFTRIVEIKHVTGQKIPCTTISKEYPIWKGEPYYPVPNKENEELYNKYQKEAEKLKNTYFLGRLAQYKYLNMDQVVENALDFFRKIEK